MDLKMMKRKLGVHAIESTDVRVGTIVVRMMKRKVATSKCFQFWLWHSRSIRNASSNGLFLILSFFGIKEFCRPLFLSTTCENFRSGSEIFSCFHWSSLTILIVACQRDGAFVPVPLIPRCGVMSIVVRKSRYRQYSCPSVGLTFHSLAN